jgi:hypothetical protein
MPITLKKRGDSSRLHIQPGSELEYEQEGLIRGQTVLEGDIAWLTKVPAIGDKHPDEPLALCYHRKIAKLPLSRLRATCSYIGIARDPTDYVVELIGALNREPIDTHRDFVSKIGGKLGSEKNNAVFDEVTGAFIAFAADAPQGLGGVEGYLLPGVNIRRSYWTKRVPATASMGKIVGRPRDMLLPADVRNMLVGPITYRLVGRLYQVSEEQLGSGADGWNTLIYP